MRDGGPFARHVRSRRATLQVDPRMRARGPFRMAARKNPFPPEAPTNPDLSDEPVTPRAGAVRGGPARASGPAPKGQRDRSQAPTLPPPKKKSGKVDPRSSGVQSSRTGKRAAPEEKGATVDEVVADLTKDPRRER